MFWFILVILATRRHLVLTAGASFKVSHPTPPPPTPTSHFFLLKASANRQVAMEAIEGLWTRLTLACSEGPTAHCAPGATTQLGEDSLLLFLL